jgi:SAM-dependent methyltransferase
MRVQQKIWQKEHRNNASIPKLASVSPGSAVVYFIKVLQTNSPHSLQKVVDIGSGKGRNTLYLAKLGYDVYAMDYIKEAAGTTKQLMKQAHLTERVHVKIAPIDHKWPFPNDYFSLAIDNYSSIDIETKKGREIYGKELFRTLKPGGYAIVAVVSADDEVEKQIMHENPGLEPNSSIWPNGKFQKNYTATELRGFYKEFKIIKIKIVKNPAVKLGKHYTATNIWTILQKPR